MLLRLRRKIRKTCPLLSGGGCGDAMVSQHILERMVHDIRFLLLPEDEMDSAEEAVYLWDNQQGTVENGHQLFRRKGSER